MYGNAIKRYIAYTRKGVGDETVNCPWCHVFPASPVNDQSSRLSSAAMLKRNKTRNVPTPLPNICVQKRRQSGLFGSKQ